MDNFEKEVRLAILLGQHKPSLFKEDADISASSVIRDLITRNQKYIISETDVIESTGILI